MRLTTKGRFAVTAMVDLSMRQTRGPVTLAAIKAEPKFKEFRLVRESRLSVVPVSDEHWKLLTKMSSGK